MNLPSTAPRNREVGQHQLIAEDPLATGVSAPFRFDIAMKRLFLLACWIASAVSVLASGETTIQSLVGREIFVEDDWAGQSFILRRHAGSLEAAWRILGSGVPVVSERVYPVEERSEKMCSFFVDVRGQGADTHGPRSQVKVALDGEGRMTLYLNGVKIHFWEKPPASPASSTPAGPPAARRQ